MEDNSSKLNRKPGKNVGTSITDEQKGKGPLKFLERKGSSSLFSLLSSVLYGHTDIKQVELTWGLKMRALEEVVSKLEFMCLWKEEYRHLPSLLPKLPWTRAAMKKMLPRRQMDIPNPFVLSSHPMVLESVHHCSFSDVRRDFSHMNQQVLPVQSLAGSSPEGGTDITRKGELVRRKMDILYHLVLSSYPMELESVDHCSFSDVRRDFSHMNQQVLQIQSLLSSENNIHLHDGEGLRLLLMISGSLFVAVERRLASFHIEAYLPHDDAIKPSDESLSLKVGQPFEVPDEMFMAAIDSAVCQVSKCIDQEDGSLRKIGISGWGGEKVAQALKDIPEIRAKFSDVVLCVSISPHYDTKEVRQNIAQQIDGLQKIADDILEEGTLNQLLPNNFLLLLDCVDNVSIDLHDLEIPDDRGFVVLTSHRRSVYMIMEVDMEIRMEDHLLPWELFCSNVGGRSFVNSSPAIQQLAVRLVKECHRHLLAIILLARTLKGATDIHLWEHALDKMIGTTKTEVLLHVLKFFWDHKDFITQYCIGYYARKLGRKQSPHLLELDWIQAGFLPLTPAIREVILQDLIDSSLLEKDGKTGVLRMRKDIEQCLIQENYFPLPSLSLFGKRPVLTNTPKIEEEWINAKEIELMNNKTSKLPENPKCPFLIILQLHNNYGLMKIPQLFFKDMPFLQNLDLSYTSIKSLPPSISSLVSLRTFNLRGCELLMELPPQIGALGNLEVFDLEGTTILHLPREMGKLIHLRCFRVSLYRVAYCHKETKQTIPTEVVSRFFRLEEVCIDVNPDGDWWHTELKATLKVLRESLSLKVLELYVPVELLKQLRWDGKRRRRQPYLSRFRFIVGGHPQRIISHLPHEVEEIFKKLEKSKKCLKYINGEDMPTEITEILNRASVFILDHHWTVNILSEFGNENMVKLKFCLLVDCPQLHTIIDGWLDDMKKPAFEQLRYLGIHYMENLRSIWKGPIGKGCLSNLTSLALHACFSLITIFTPDFIENLKSLKELIVEDCPKIECLVSPECLELKSDHFLRNLKKISLLDLPQLVTMTGFRKMGSSSVDTLIVYNCPKLDNLYAKETCTVYHKIVGEKKWWDALKWNDSEWKKIAQGAYEELKGGEDLMERLAKMVHSEIPNRK